MLLPMLQELVVVVIIINHLLQATNHSSLISGPRKLIPRSREPKTATSSTINPRGGSKNTSRTCRCCCWSSCCSYSSAGRYHRVWRGYRQWYKTTTIQTTQQKTRQRHPYLHDDLKVVEKELESCPTVHWGLPFFQKYVWPAMPWWTATNTAKNQSVERLGEESKRSTMSTTHHIKTGKSDLFVSMGILHVRRTYGSGSVLRPILSHSTYCIVCCLQDLVV